MTLDASRVREIFTYEPSEGILRWREAKGARAPKGSAAGSSHSRGYIHINLDKRFQFAHRLAWLYVHGEWPKGQIDHINGVKTDNRIDNLRDVSRSMNQQNIRRAPANSTVGVLGAAAQGGRYRARIRVDGKVKHIGYFATPQLAHTAYVEAKRVHHEGCTI